ncbi:uncharacterized protein LOC107993966 isoform X3 [Apis cerana]|uniref:uncharacterized protein LOC107993966 isoform X3 n=1 Tax=Apis cerana TaxID=7461 RepID=UPI00109BB7A6|nr:uncharacterized protein LOC107993966 isoform X3 [Apis cerana]
MFQAYYSNSEPLFKCIKLCDDATSMKTFMNMVFKQMEGMIGFCAIREGSNELVGVLIASLFKKFNWIIKKGQGETLCHVMSLKNYAFAKSRFIESIYINKSVHIDIICVKPDHQRRGVGTALLRSCITRLKD